MKKFRKSSKSNLDEMQEQKLLHIEKQGFWLLYWMIALDLTVKCILNVPKTAVLGEMLCFIVSGIFVVWRCLRNGIWDRRIKADSRSNFVISLIGAAVVAVVNGAVYCRSAGEKFSVGSLAGVAVCSGIFTLLLAFFILSMCAAAYKKKAHQLETEEGEEDD